MSFNDYILSIPPERLKLMVRNGKRSSVLNGFDFESLIYCTWRMVKETIPELIKTNDLEKMVVEIFKDRGITLFYNEIGHWDYNGIMYFILWVIDEVEAIANMESKYLSSEPDIDMIAAGVNDLNQFGDLNSIDALAIKYHVSHDEVKDWRYNIVFDLLYKSIIENRIEKNLIKIKTPKKNGKH